MIYKELNRSDGHPLLFGRSPGPVVIVPSPAAPGDRGVAPCLGVGAGHAVPAPLGAPDGSADCGGGRALERGACRRPGDPVGDPSSWPLGSPCSNTRAAAFFLQCTIEGLPAGCSRCNCQIRPSFHVSYFTVDCKIGNFEEPVLGVMKEVCVYQLWKLLEEIMSVEPYSNAAETASSIA